MSNPNPPIRPMAAKSNVPAKKLTHWDLLFRFITFVLISSSVAFAWWTYSKKLIPLQKQSRALTADVSRTSAEVDTLERKWPPVQREQIRTDYQEVKNQLFADEAELGRWLVRLQEEAGPLALDINVDFGK